MHSSRMRTAHSLTVFHSIHGGGVGCLPNTPGGSPLWMQTPLEANPPGHLTWDACWEANPLWTEGMTHACENITLPQTSFAGGN